MTEEIKREIVKKIQDELAVIDKTSDYGVLLSVTEAEAILSFLGDGKKDKGEKMYTKNQFLEAAKLGEVSMIDAEYTVSLLDEGVIGDGKKEGGEAHTAPEVFHKLFGFAFIGGNTSIKITKNQIYEAMEAYAQQFKYDFSSVCQCKDRIGETWCCNQCGLPVPPSSIPPSEMKYKKALEEILAMQEDINLISTLSLTDMLVRINNVVHGVLSPSLLAGKEQTGKEAC